MWRAAAVVGRMLGCRQAYSQATWANQFEPRPQFRVAITNRQSSMLPRSYRPHGTSVGEFMMFRTLTVAMLSCFTIYAQSDQPAATRPEFEVASIKPAAADQRGMFIRPGANGGITINNMPLKELIVIAWRIQPFQISGGPSWIESARYDIIAKPEGQRKRSDIPLMLQTLLEDRFQLKIRKETKELPIYALVVARKDGKLGPQLVPSKDGSCAPFDPSKPPPPTDPKSPPKLGCGGMMMGPDRINAVGADIAQLQPILSRTLGRTVIDKTGLTGKFDITAHWTPDQAQLQLMMPPGGPPPGMPAPQFDPNGPSIFTALEEQLGLKLESQKGPVDILVIDHIERPSDN